MTPDIGAFDDATGLTLVVSEQRSTERTMLELMDIFSRHAGDTEVVYKMHSGRSAKVFEVPHKVSITADLFGDLKGLLGPQCIG